MLSTVNHRLGSLLALSILLHQDSPLLLCRESIVKIVKHFIFNLLTGPIILQGNYMLQAGLGFNLGNAELGL